MREGDEAERRDTATSWGEVNTVSQSRCVAVEKRQSRSEGVSSEKEKKKKSASLFLSEWLEGEPGWCDLLHHGMQPLYPAEA